jgi:hypothetical protein
MRVVSDFLRIGERAISESSINLESLSSILVEGMQVEVHISY